MKVIIDGHEVECSVEEYKELRLIEDKKKEPKKTYTTKWETTEEDIIPVVEKKVVVVNKERKQYNKLDWTDIYKKTRKMVLESDKPLNVRNILRNLGLSSGGSNHNNICSMLHSSRGIRKVTDGFIALDKVESLEKKKPVIKKNKVEKKHIQDTEVNIKRKEKLAIRNKFIFSRANQLMKNDVRMSREKAFSIAVGEWNIKNGIVPVGTKINGVTQKPIRIIENFPHIFPLTRDSNDVFCSMLKTMLGSDDKKLTYHNVKHHLMTEKGEWNGRIWMSFIYDITKKSSQILAYFNVGGRLVIEKDGGGHHILVYRK